MGENFDLDIKKVALLSCLTIRIEKILDRQMLGIKPYERLNWD